MSVLSAMVDAREPSWVKSLKFEGGPVDVSLLDAGDVLCIGSDGKIVGVERKTATDFLNTLRDERLFPQLVKLRYLTPWAYLLICGNILPASGGKCFVNGVETGWNWASVTGALLTVQELGVGVVNVASDADFESAVIRLVNRDRGELRIGAARDVTITNDAIAILASLPGIGADRASKLLEYCGSPGWALSFLTDPFFHGAIPGFGPAIKARVREALGLNAAEILTVVDPAGSPMLMKETTNV